MPTPSAPLISGLDHVLVAVANLDEAEERWRRLGFTVSPPGRHPGRGTGNRCVMLGATYIELLGVVERGEGSLAVAEALKMRKAPTGIAFACEDAVALRAALMGKVDGLGAVHKGSRMILDPAGEISVAFDIVAYPTDTRWPRLLACQHHDLKRVFTPEWTEHENGALDISEVLLSVANVATVAAFGGYARRAFPGVRVRVDLNAVELAFAEFRLQVSGGPADPRPWWGTVVITVADLAATMRALDAARVEFTTRSAASIELHPDDCDGIVLRFVAPGRR
jgi:catechol 2,3-dioxygenase-like lactoylglutathione lyase family enzyme